MPLFDKQKLVIIESLTMLNINEISFVDIFFINENMLTKK